MTLEEMDEDLLRLREENAPEERVADAASRLLDRLLELEYASLAAWHAGAYGAFWDDGRKLDILERFHAQGMTAQAIALCHRWKMSAVCRKSKRELYQELFPQLPPRTFKGEST